ncbi:MAG TPA: iron-containing redox enzyme family protein [Archangium sp.]|nr:iron-containing redox enzyme family protein [Archangium sp.]
MSTPSQSSLVPSATAAEPSPFGPTHSPFAGMRPDTPLQTETLQELESIWARYELRMRSAPIFQKLYGGDFTVEDYKALLRTLRPQVVEGSRWITRVASSCSDDALRALFIGHAREEHLDYQMLERDYVSVGGDLAEIQQAEKNVGGEAISAYIFHEGLRDNPIHLLGAVFVIEGTGDQLMGRWGEQIQKRLGLTPQQTSFFSYHGGNDENHVRQMERVLKSRWMDAAMARRFLKATQVSATLYHLQYSLV